MWERSIESIVERPMFGKGVGTGAEPLPYQAASGEQQVLTDAHNVWLSVALQAGVLGLAAFVALVAYVWRRARPLPGDGSQSSVLKLSLRCALVAALFYQGLTGSFEETRHLWVLMGLMVAARDLRWG
jgi:O-antigen ligase